jgi:hypothetical protein
VTIVGTSAETSGGGIPGWVTTLPGDPSWSPYNGELRSNDTYFHNAWQGYVGCSFAHLLATFTVSPADTSNGKDYSKEPGHQRWPSYHGPGVFECPASHVRFLFYWVLMGPTG